MRGKSFFRSRRYIGANTEILTRSPQPQMQMRADTATDVRELSRRRPLSTQQMVVALREVRDDMLCLDASGQLAPSSRHARRRKSDTSGMEQPRSAPDTERLYRAILEVGSTNFALKSTAEQEAILAGYRSFLNGLGCHIQILVRVLPLDLEPYLARLRICARDAARNDMRLAQLAADHETFVRHLATEHTLLERRFYLAIPAEQAPTYGNGLLGAAMMPGPMTRGGIPAVSGLLPWIRRARREAKRRGRFDVAVQRVQLHADDVTRQLTRFGVEARRVCGRELIDVYARCLTPSRSPITEMVASAPTHALLQAMSSAQDVSGVASEPEGGVPDGGANEVGPMAPERADVDATADSSDAGEMGRDDHSSTRIAAGAQTLSDAIAPAAVEIFRDALRIDDDWVRVLAVTGYPRSVYPGWLAMLVDLDEPFELALHIYPLASGAMIRSLSHRMVALHSSRLLDQRHGRLADPEREVAYADMDRLRNALQRGDERVFSLSLYLLVRGRTRRILDERCAHIQTTLDNLQVQSRPATLEHDLGLTSCLPEARDKLQRYRTFDTSSLATTFPFTSSGLSMREGILYGVVPQTGSLVILDPFARELENANQVVFAKSGAGKSYACKLQALRALLLGTEVCVVDPEDEYRPLCMAVGGQYIRLAPGSGQHINPFDLSPRLHRRGATSATVGRTPENKNGDDNGSGDAAVEREGGDNSNTGGDPLAEKVQSLHALLDLMLADHGPSVGLTSGAPGLSQREKGLLDRALYETYRRVGITSDPHTHDRPAPLLRDLYDVLTAGMCGSDEYGLAERLHRYVDGSLARLFSAPTDVALDARLVVFDVRDLDAELRPIGLLLIADFVWTRVRRQRKPRLLLIDEAWSLIQHAEGGRFLAGLARRARKHYLGLVTITQDVEDFLGSEWGRTVLANSSIQMLMKQDSTTIEAVSAAFRLSAGERQYLLGCHKGEGLLFARGGHVALRVESSLAEHALVTTDPHELAQRHSGSVAAWSEAPVPASAAAADLQDRSTDDERTSSHVTARPATSVPTTSRTRQRTRKRAV